MRTLLLSSLSLLFCVATFAQAGDTLIIIKGTVQDSVSGKPISYATIALQDTKTHLAVRTTLSHDDGSFSLSARKGKSYMISLSMEGYKAKSLPIPEGKSEVLLPPVLMASADKELKDVTITALKPVLKRELDGLTYDVTADPESVSLSALDMMRKIPMLTVDAEDNIKLKGSSNYKILINGKESALVAKNPSDVLKAMPATNIERIEVITTPPAKYDAEGLAGIINIITKKNVGQGYNIGVNGRYNSVWGPGLNLNGTMKQGKFGMSGYLGMGNFTSPTTAFGNEQTFFPGYSVLSQDGSNTFHGTRQYGSLELSYEIDSLDLLTGSFDMFHGTNQNNSIQLSSTYDSSANLLQQYTMTSSSRNTWQGMDVGFNYQRGFKKDKSRLLTFSYKYNYSPGTQYTSNLFSNPYNFQSPDFEQYNDAGNKEHTIQLDYVHPVKKLTVEAGVKGILRNNFSNFQTNNYVDSSKEYVINPAQSDSFSYHQDIYSIYNSYQYKWEKWSAKAGLRLEHTSINAHFMSVSDAVTEDYNNLIPSVSIQRSFAHSSWNIGYTDRISRPGIYQLNPFVDQSNPKFINTGNPNLKPELNHTFELNYSHFAKASLNIGLSYAFSTNSIQNVSSLQTVNGSNGQLDTVTVTTFENLGRNSSLGLNFSVNFSIIKDLTVSLNGRLSSLWLEGAYNGQLYHNQGFTGYSFMNAGYKFGKDKLFRFGIDAGYFSGDVNLQGKSSPWIYSSYVLARTFMQKKMTISLVANNPYTKLYTRHSNTSTPDFYQSSFNQDPYRTFAIRFNYKFGKLSTDIKRNQRGINNDDTKGGKSGNSSQ